MITIRQITAYGLAAASQILLPCIILSPFLVIEALSANAAIAEAGDTRLAYGGNRDTRADAADRFQNVYAKGSHVPVRNLKFSHLTTNDGLSQAYVAAILQDRRGFMWFATRDGLNRYDGNTFVVYKSKPNDPDTLTSNFLHDVIEDDHGFLWVASNNGVSKFDPRTERCTRYLHDPNNPNTLAGGYVTSIIQDARGSLWFGTRDRGLDRFDPLAQRFTHYRKDDSDQPVGRIAQVIEDKQREIWFVGERGLFHLNQPSGEITRSRAVSKDLSAESMYEDEDGNFWILAESPIIALVKYDRKAERLTNYPLIDTTAVAQRWTAGGGSTKGSLAAEGRNGLWVPSSLGLSYFDRHKERFAYRFEHDETDPGSLDSNAIMSIYQDRGGVLWVGTENAGLNILDFRQQQFGLYQHRAQDPHSILPGRVKALYEEPNGILWIGYFPRALDRLDRNTGNITHYVPARDGENTLGEGTNVDHIYKDAAGYIWIAGGGAGLARFDERTGRFKHYRHDPEDPHSLIDDNAYVVYGDRSSRMWVGEQEGLSLYDPATDRFTNYRPDPNSVSSSANFITTIYQDRSGTLWLGVFSGALIRFDEKTTSFVSNSPDSHDPTKLNGSGLNSIHEDRSGTLWVGTFDGLYRYNRKNETFTRYTEAQGLPSSAIRCILEDQVGRLWLSTDKGISRFDPRRETFRNYDASDGLQSNEFSDGCYRSPDGEMFFGGTNGFNAFFPENLRDDSYVPPVAITSFKIFNKTVPIAPDSVLKKSVPYIDSLTLPYSDHIFSFEFAALSYANSQKNRYRYRLDRLEPDWNEVGSGQRLATYTNLDPGKYVFRVQASNSDGAWNQEGVSLPIRIMPPWWMTTWFRALCVVGVLTLLWGGYQFRVRQLQQQFALTLDARVAERTRIARDLHDTLLQDFQAVLPLFQVGIIKLPEGAGESRKTLEQALDQAEHAISVGRDAIKGLRISTIEKNDLAMAIRTAGEELAAAEKERDSVSFELLVEGTTRELHPILRDEIYRLATEALRNAFRHADPKNVEVEIRYDERYFRLRVRDDGKGIPSDILNRDSREGHYGLPGMRERAKLVGGKLTIWTEQDSGTEIELVIPGTKAYPRSIRCLWYFGRRSAIETDSNERIGP